MPELSLDPDKIYEMPMHLHVQPLKNKGYLVIAVDYSNWLFFANENQLSIYKDLQLGKSVGEIYENYAENTPEDFITVLTELEAKHFEEKFSDDPQKHGMYIYLTNKCNQRCHHCYMRAGEVLNNEMTTAEVKTLLKSFSALGGKVITFTGGEVTVRKDFVEIVNYAKQCGLTVGVLSNGLRWNESLISQTKGSIDEIQISIDGFDPNSYKHIRGTDSFLTVLNSVDLLINSGLRVTVAITPLLETLISSEQEYIKFAKGLNEKYKDKEFFIKFSSELMDGRNISLSKDELKSYVSVIKRVEKICAKLSENEIFALNRRYNVSLKSCGYGELSIAANGDIYFCNLINKCSKQGNIRTDNLSDIYHKAEIAYRLASVDNLVPCGQCPLKNICGGGCRVKFFPELVTQTDWSTGKSPNFKRSVLCNDEYRQSIYFRMVETNDLFYR